MQQDTVLKKLPLPPPGKICWYSGLSSTEMLQYRVLKRCPNLPMVKFVLVLQPWCNRNVAVYSLEIAAPTHPPHPKEKGREKRVPLTL